VVEDQPAQQAALRVTLGARGYGVEVASTGVEALELVGLINPDVILLDLGLPDCDGLDVLVDLTRCTRSPIIVVTADDVDDRMVRALDGGAVDYVVKPFSADVLLARVRVSLRHATAVAQLVEERTLTCGDVVVDLAAHQVTVGGEVVECHPKPFDLLVALMRNEGRLMTQPTLIRTLYGYDAKKDQVYNLRTAVSKVRRLLGEGPDRPVLITEQRAGYRLVAPQP
jgi:two-component system KDP operon response regulator KdpE